MAEKVKAKKAKAPSKKASPKARKSEAAVKQEEETTPVIKRNKTGKILAKSALGVVLAAHFYFGEDVFIAGGVAIVVEVNHRAMNIKLGNHLGLTNDIVDHQRMNFAWWLIDKRAGRRDPVMFQIAPRTFDHIACYPGWMNVARQDTRLPYAQQIAPTTSDGVHQ